MSMMFSLVYEVGIFCGIVIIDFGRVKVFIIWNNCF